MALANGLGVLHVKDIVKRLRAVAADKAARVIPGKKEVRSNKKQKKTNVSLLSPSADGLFVDDKVAALEALEIRRLEIVALTVGLAAKRKVKLVESGRAAESRRKEHQTQQSQKREANKKDSRLAGEAFLVIQGGSVHSHHLPVQLLATSSTIQP